MEHMCVLIYNQQIYVHCLGLDTGDNAIQTLWWECAKEIISSSQ